jgi:hypothetical protein
MRYLNGSRKRIERRLSDLRPSHRSDSHRIPLRRNLECEGAAPRLARLRRLANQSQLETGAPLLYGEEVTEAIRH